jgi:hypothetical protein
MPASAYPGWTYSTAIRRSSRFHDRSHVARTRCIGPRLLSIADAKRSRLLNKEVYAT